MRSRARVGQFEIGVHQSREKCPRRVKPCGRAEVRAENRAPQREATAFHVNQREASNVGTHDRQPGRTQTRASFGVRDSPCVSKCRRMAGTYFAKNMLLGVCIPCQFKETLSVFSATAGGRG